MVGNMGASMIQGFQQDDFTGTEKVIACAKHMIGGSESINGLNASPAGYLHANFKRSLFTTL